MSEIEELRICESHGPFRGEGCPECHEKGKGLLFSDEIEAIGRILAGMLRHFPENYGVRLNSHGFARIYSVVPAIRAERPRFRWIRAEHIAALGMTDPRGRYEVIDEEEIRATYGHTIEVNLSDLPTDNLPEIVYYQTTPEELELLKETGISPADKTYIHLSSTYRKAYVSGKFHVDDPLIIGIKASELMESGIPVYRASHEVYLTKEIPPSFMVDIEMEPVELTEEENEELERFRRRRERRIGLDNGKENF